MKESYRIFSFFWGGGKFFVCLSQSHNSEEKHAKLFTLSWSYMIFWILLTILRILDGS